MNESRYQFLMNMCIEEMVKCKNEYNISPLVCVRDVVFRVEEDTPTLQIYLDAGEGGVGDLGLPVIIDDCSRFHHWLENHSLLNDIPSGIAVEVSSLGVEPPLRTLAHWEKCVGKVVRCLCWGERSSKEIKGILVSVDSFNNEILLKVSEKEEKVSISNIRHAFLCYFESLEMEKSLKKVPKQKKKKVE